MSSDLSNQYIDDTFDGLLHLNGDPLPSSGKGKVYDGSGQESALSVGVSGNGVGVSGKLTSTQLTVGSLSYSESGLKDSLLYCTSDDQVGTLAKGELSQSYLTDISDVAGDYSVVEMDSITISSKGIVTEVVASESTPDDVTRIYKTYHLKTPVKLKNNVNVKNSAAGYTIVSIDSIVTGAVAAIGYISVYTGDSDHRITMAVTDNNSKDPSDWTPILTAVGQGGSGMLLSGNQFITPVATNGKFYICNTGDIDGLTNGLAGRTSGQEITMDIWILGYHK